MGSTAGRGRGHPEHTGCDQSVTIRWLSRQFDAALALERTKGETGPMPRLLSVIVPVGSLLVAACSSAGPASSSSADPTPQPSRGATVAATSFTTWGTYHRTSSRTGRPVKAAGTQSHMAWSKGVGQPLYGERLVVGTTLSPSNARNKFYR